MGVFMGTELYARFDAVCMSALQQVRGDGSGEADTEFLSYNAVQDKGNEGIAETNKNSRPLTHRRASGILFALDAVARFLPAAKGRDG